MSFLDLVPKNESPEARIVQSALDAPPEEVEDNFIADAMNRAYDPEINMVRDMRIDDTALAFAKNYYDYTANVIGVDTPAGLKMPFARQLWLCLKLLNELCPVCTRRSYFENIQEVPVDADPHDLIKGKYLVLFRHGVCPKCGMTRGKAIKEKLCLDYNEAVWVIGQRAGKCLKAGTLVQTDRGLLPIEELCSDNPGGWRPYKEGARVVLEDGSSAAIRRTYVAPPERLVTATLDDGRQLTGTSDHPVFTQRGWVTFGNLTRDDWTPIRVGQGAFAKEQVRFSDALNGKAQATWNEYTHMVHASVASRSQYAFDFPVGSLDEETAFLLGLYLAEGHCDTKDRLIPLGMSIANTDLDILRRAHHSASLLYPQVIPPFDESQAIAYKRWGFRNAKAAVHLDALLDGGLRCASADKFIPSSILRSPKSVQVAFLQALFEGDGGVNAGRVEYVSLSDQLTRSLQFMLGNLGIYSEHATGVSWATNGSPAQVEKSVHAVRIVGKYALTRFSSEVGFISERKKEALDRLLTRMGKSDRRQNPFKGDALPPHLEQEWLDLDRRVKSDVERIIASGYSYVDSSGRTTRHVRKNWLKGCGNLRAGWCGITRTAVASSLFSLSSSPLWAHMSSSLQDALEKFADRTQDYDVVWVRVADLTRGTRKEVTYDIEVPGPHRFLANGVVSHNSTTASMLTTYVFHRLLKSPPLAKVATGIQGSTQLTASFIALTTTNSYNLLWKPVRDTMVASAWYKDFFDFMDEKKRELGKEFYQFNPTGTYFRSFLKNIDAFPVGPSKRILRGPTRVLAVTDELGHFPFNPNQAEEEEGEDERERANADEVHMVLTNSLATVRAEVMSLHEKGIYTYPQGLNLSISSPASWRDKVMRLYVEAQSSTDMLGVRLPTWEVSPIYTRNHPLIVSMYHKNPKKAERDFGANPPKLTSGVFTKEAILPLFKGSMQVGLRYDTPKETDSFTNAEAVQLREEAILQPALLSLDAGLVNNAFALVLLRPVFNADRTEIDRIQAPVVLEVVPRGGTTIDYVGVYERIIKKLIALNVREVYADRWNSAYILRAIETQSKGKIKAVQYSLKSRDFDQFISYVNTGQLELPAIEIDPDVAELTVNFKTELLRYPAAHLYRQFLTVQSYQGMLVKGSDSTDDMFRALVLGVTRFFDTKVVKNFVGYKPVQRGGSSSHATVIVSGRSTFPYRPY